MAGFADERAAIEKRLADNFTTLPISFDNQRFDPPQTAWVALSILSGDGDQASIGTDVPMQRYIGIIQVDIYVPAGTGTAALRGYADTIDSIFRRQTISFGSSGYIKCRTPSFNQLPAQEGWFRGVLSIPFQRDKIH